MKTILKEEWTEHGINVEIKKDKEEGTIDINMICIKDGTIYQQFKISQSSFYMKSGDNWWFNIININSGQGKGNPEIELEIDG